MFGLFLLCLVNRSRDPGEQDNFEKYSCVGIKRYSYLLYSMQCTVQYRYNEFYRETNLVDHSNCAINLSAVISPP